MSPAAAPPLTRTASDLMSRDLIVIPQDTPMRDAARLLLQTQVSGAPVVDGRGRCVGLLSTTDFLRLAYPLPSAFPGGSTIPVTCSFQQKAVVGGDGQEMIACSLRLGACPLQREEKGRDGKIRITCSEPHCVPTDWQIVNVEQVPSQPVRQYMTPDLATTEPDTPLPELARQMIDAQVHRLVVLDEQSRPIGIVSSGDVLAAVASAHCRR